MRTPAQQEAIGWAWEVRMANYDARLADFVARGGLGLPPWRAALRFGVSERTVWRWRRALRVELGEVA